MAPNVLRMYAPDELEVERLGSCEIASPYPHGESIDESARVLAVDSASDAERYLQAQLPLPSFEPAGPRRQLFFEPSEIHCAIVTCGGLCPGQNDVVRSIVLTLKYGYGVERVLGFRYGYNGLGENPHAPPIPLTQETVANIHRHGGTLLGSSRGTPGTEQIVQTLIDRRIDVLFAIGGDGTLRGAQAIAAEVQRRKKSIAVVGVPKTIDNDLLWVARSFGFATSVEEARRAIAAANVEANGAWNGVGLVKLMGRHSGFIAAHASLANSDVNFCIIPEIPFELHGESGFLESLVRRLHARHHAVVVVAEGAGQHLIGVPDKSEKPQRDASGNVKLKDIGLYLQDQISTHLRLQQLDGTVKYIDPSYMVRSLPANSLDAEFCLILGQHAVHAAMAGRTNMLIGYWNQRFTHLPIAATVESRKQIDRRGAIWQAVLQSTGQAPPAPTRAAKQPQPA
jgi:6-phosphofructokinase 1